MLLVPAILSSCSYCYHDIICFFYISQSSFTLSLTSCKNTGLVLSIPSFLSSIYRILHIALYLLIVIEAIIVFFCTLYNCGAFAFMLKIMKFMWQLNLICMAFAIDTDILKLVLFCNRSQFDAFE